MALFFLQAMVENDHKIINLSHEVFRVFFPLIAPCHITKGIVYVIGKFETFAQV